VNSELEQPEHAAVAVEWFEAKLNRAIRKVDDQFRKYRISDALMILYKLFWDEFSSWYLETIKPAYQAPIDAFTLERTIGFIDRLLHLLHPFMPFITEEIWQLVATRKPGESLMVSPMPRYHKYDRNLIHAFEDLKEVITSIRSIRKDKNLPPKETMKLLVRSSANGNYQAALEPVIIKLANLSEVEMITDDPADAVSFMVKNVEFFVPMGSKVNKEEEIDKLTSELEYTRGFLKSVQKKLSNERFVQNAPEAVVEKERQKMTDATEKIKVLKSQIEKLKS
jgi:valyl-tRNA synthetase